jgi:hypothetical protein
MFGCEISYWVVTCCETHRGRETHRGDAGQVMHPDFWNGR